MPVSMFSMFVFATTSRERRLSNTHTYIKIFWFSVHGIIISVHGFLLKYFTWCFLTVFNFISLQRTSAKEPGKFISNVAAPKHAQTMLKTPPAHPQHAPRAASVRTGSLLKTRSVSLPRHASVSIKEKFLRSVPLMCFLVVSCSVCYPKPQFYNQLTSTFSRIKSV